MPTVIGVAIAVGVGSAVAVADGLGSAVAVAVALGLGVGDGLVFGAGPQAVRAARPSSRTLSRCSGWVDFIFSVLPSAVGSDRGMIYPNYFFVNDRLPTDG